METVLTVKNMILGKWNPLLGQVLRREMRLRRSCGEWALGHFGAATLNWRTWEQQGKLLEATGNVSENRNGGFKSSGKDGRNIVGCHRWFWWPSNGWQTWKSCPRCVLLTRQRRPVGRAVKAMDETEMASLNRHESCWKKWEKRKQTQCRFYKRPTTVAETPLNEWWTNCEVTVRRPTTCKHEILGWGKQEKLLPTNNSFWEQKNMSHLDPPANGQAVI